MNLVMSNIEPQQTTEKALSTRLFDELNQHEIVYCHWKSNELLAEGLRGETDLDIFAERSSFTPTIAILLNLGFKQAEVRWGPRTPGVLHFYAFDPCANDLIHVHLYSRLMTGESLVKSHVLPCEAMLLEGSERIGNVQVPTKEAEAALCVLRSFIKNGSLLHTWLHGRGRTPDEPSEFWFADEGVKAEAAYEVLQQHSGAIDKRLFLKCFRALAEDWPALNKWMLGLQMRRCMRGCARHTYFGRLTSYCGLIVTKLRRFACGKTKNKVLNSGGAVIAFIGGDATGKSTLVNETKRWLGGTFAVRVAHVGKPSATWLTMPLSIWLPLARRIFPGQRHQTRQAAEALAKKSKQQDKPKHGTSLLYALRAVALAWDRSKLLRKVHRQAGAGEIVICDRYPTDTPGGPDGPRLRECGDTQSWLLNFLARTEHRLYARNAPPDVVLRLHVSIETAKQRNQLRTKLDKHSDEDLVIRHQKVRAWKNTGAKVVREIDTEANLDQTILSVKESIWESL